MNALLSSQLGLVVLALGALSACSADDGGDGPSADAPFPADAAENLGLRFDGVDDYATTGLAGFPAAAAPQSLSARLRIAGNTGVQAVLVLRLDFEHGVALGVQDGIPTAWRVWGGNVFVTGPSLDDGAWHHVAYVSTGTTGGDDATHILYVDGEEVNRAVSVPSKRTPTSAWLGSLDGKSQLYHGELDDVRVWDGIRTPEDIAAEAAGDVPEQHPELIAYWTFDESSGVRAADRSGSGNHAVLGDGIPDFMPERAPVEP